MVATKNALVEDRVKLSAKIEAMKLRINGLDHDMMGNNSEKNVLQKDAEDWEAKYQTVLAKW